MLCDVCKQNQATIRLISLVDGQKTERHLCTKCVTNQRFLLRTEGVTNILSAFIQNNLGKRAMKTSDIRCTGCGTRYDDMVRTARAGCTQCYQDFAVQLKPLLERMHGNARHVGRIPQNVEPSMKTQKRIEQIRREMDIAVVLEDFELAAELRDEIKELDLKSHGGFRNA